MWRAGGGRSSPVRKLLGCCQRIFYLEKKKVNSQQKKGLIDNWGSGLTSLWGVLRQNELL